MSLVASSPLSRGQNSPFPSSLAHEAANQQVPGSPISPFFLSGGRGIARAAGLCSPSSGSPLAQVPDGGSPLLRRLLACRKREREEDSSPPPSPSSAGGHRRRRDSPRVPSSIIIVRRAAVPAFTGPKFKRKDDQVVPSLSTPIKAGATPEEGDNDKADRLDGLRKLPEITGNTKLLDLFGETAEIFATTHEE